MSELVELLIGHQHGCLWCGKSMKNTYGHQKEKGRFILGRGYLGQGVFCTLTCGYRFAVAVVREAEEVNST